MSDWQQMIQADVLSLGMAADEVRRASPDGTIVTYLRVFELTPGDFAHEIQVPDGAGEVRLYVVPSSVNEAVEQIRRARAAAGTRRLSAFSWADLDDRGWTDAATLAALVGAGLDDVAELPVDRISDVTDAVRRLEAAGVRPRRLTVSDPIQGDRADLIRRASEVFDGHATLRRFSPLPRVAPVDKPTTGYDDVRMVALARLALPARSIEVDWKLYGPKLAQVALTFGADHLDAVSAFDDASLGPRRATVEEVERNIRAARFEPKEYRP